jgi:hypothetical protein
MPSHTSSIIATFFIAPIHKRGKATLIAVEIVRTTAKSTPFLYGAM